MKADSSRSESSVPRVVTLIRYPPLDNVNPGGWRLRLPVKPEEGREDSAAQLDKRAVKVPLLRDSRESPRSVQWKIVKANSTLIQQRIKGRTVLEGSVTSLAISTRTEASLSSTKGKPRETDF